MSAAGSQRDPAPWCWCRLPTHLNLSPQVAAGKRRGSIHALFGAANKAARTHKQAPQQQDPSGSPEAAPATAAAVQQQGHGHRHGGAGGCNANGTAAAEEEPALAAETAAAMAAAEAMAAVVPGVIISAAELLRAQMSAVQSATDTNVHVHGSSPHAPTSYAAAGMAGTGTGAGTTSGPGGGPAVGGSAQGSAVGSRTGEAAGGQVHAPEVAGHRNEPGDVRRERLSMPASSDVAAAAAPAPAPSADRQGQGRQGCMAGAATGSAPRPTAQISDLSGTGRGSSTGRPRGSTGARQAPAGQQQGPKQATLRQFFAPKQPQHQK